MKTTKNIFAGILLAVIYLSAATIYYIDRIICAVLPWFEVKSISDWQPKSTELSDIRKEFPHLSTEHCIEIKQSRIAMKYEEVKNSLIRIGAITTGIIVYEMVKMIF